jgi:signal peptidase I
VCQEASPVACTAATPKVHLRSSLNTSQRVEAVARRWVVAAAVVLSGLIAIVILRPAWGVKTYEGTDILLNAPAARAGATGAAAPGKDQFLLKPKAMAALATSEGVMRGVAGRLGYDGDIRALTQEVRASADETSGVLGITARRHSPAQAEALADATAAELIAQLDQARATARANAIAEANDRATKLAAAGLGADAARARQEAADLTAGEGLAGVIPLERAKAHVVGSGVTAAIPPWLGWLLTLVVFGGGAIGLALVVDRLDPSINDSSDAASALDLPVLATVEPPGDDDVPGGDPDGPRAERARAALAALRAQMPPRLATQLESFAVPKLPAGVSLAVAPVAGGKEIDDSSVVAVDLAAAAAHSGLRALILDCEPPSDEHDGTTPPAGLAEVLAGQVALADVCRPTSLAGVALVGAGAPRNARSLTNGAVGQLVRAGRGLADVVVLKGSPITAGDDDGVAFIDATDGVVVVCRAGTTSKQDAARARAVLESRRSLAGGVVVTTPPPDRVVRWLQARSERGTETSRAHRRRNRLEWAGTLVGMFVLFLLLRAFVMESFTIPSPSMAPYLVPGDRVLVSRISYDLHAIHRGDVIVFDRPLPFLNEAHLIKRVIALPGETVESRDGRIYVNDKLLPETYLAKGVRTDGVARQKVPPGKYWVMGDNRTNSGDSRFFGPIRRGLVVGRAFFHLWRPPFGFM